MDSISATATQRFRCHKESVRSGREQRREHQTQATVDAPSSGVYARNWFRVRSAQARSGELLRATGVHNSRLGSGFVGGPGSHYVSDYVP